MRSRVFFRSGPEYFLVRSGLVHSSVLIWSGPVRLAETHHVCRCAPGVTETTDALLSNQRATSQDCSDSLQWVRACVRSQLVEKNANLPCRCTRLTCRCHPALSPSTDRHPKPSGRSEMCPAETRPRAAIRRRRRGRQQPKRSESVKKRVEGE